MAEARKRRSPAGAREAQRLERRTAIIDAAERVFAVKPFSKVSMRDIAREAGISPALTYRHFPDQQHLFVEAFLRGSHRLIDQFGELGGGTRAASLEEIAEVFIAYLTEHEQYFKMMTHFMLEGNLHEGLLDRINAAERSLLDQFAGVFASLGARTDTRMMSHAFFAALNGVLITFRRLPGRSQDELKKHMDAIARIMASLFAHAVKCGEPGGTG
jgi:AcrR family transcriptional regulator